MLDKLRSKSQDNGNSTTDAESPRRASDDSKSQLLQVPRDPSYAEDRRRSSTPGPNSTSTSRSTSGDRTSSDTSRRNSVNPSAKTRKRDLFWRTGLWDETCRQPEGQHVRAMSQSVHLTHPEVAEEQMRAMYPQWRT